MRKLSNSELGRKTVEDFRRSEKLSVIIVLDNVRSLNNIGSVFRTADAFLVEAIYLCGITARPPHRDIQKTALGATDSVAWSYFDTTTRAIEELKKKGFYVVSLEQAEGSVGLYEFQLNRLDREFCELFEEYMPYLGMSLAGYTSQMRVVPVASSFSDGAKIEP